MVGMDTLSRKQLVEIIRAAKSEHTILLATHYMDVADDVSDRIIILSNGKIVCNGSSNFLKANVETGFLLTVEFTRAIGMESYQQFADVVLSIVTKHCKNASIDGSANRQFTIFLPRGTQRSFPLIFNELETQKDALQIDSYDIRANTLEQVFIK
uniref:Uncharacterized protein n=1 Tax=Panagrolaimus superbus TaxID=310955 RepID=A0A914Y958_9BILA